MNTRFRILQNDDPRFINFAKKKVRQILGMGILNFNRSWTLDDTSISVKVTTVGDEAEARIRVSGDDQKLLRGRPVVRLGTESAIINILKKTGGVGGSSSMVIERPAIANALRAHKKVVYMEPYISVSGYMISFTSTPFYSKFVDEHAGSFWLKSAPHDPREIDFVSGYVWYKYTDPPVSSLSEHRNPSWAALSLDVIIDKYSSNFNITRSYDSTLKRDVISNGDQSFQLPMAEGRFTLKLTVTFENENVSSYVTETKGDWTAEILSVSITKNDRTGATLRVKYDQEHFGTSVFFVQNIKSWTLPPVTEGGYAASYVYETINPSLFGNDLIGRVTVPPLGTLTTRTFYEVAKSSLVTPLPWPLFAYSESTNTYTLSSAAAVTNNFNNASQIADREYEAAFYVVYSDGTTERVSDDDTTETITYTSSSGSPGGVPSSYTHEWYGPNVRGPFVYHVPGGGSSMNGAVWITDESDSLGYSIKRSVPTYSGFPAAKEVYEIISDTVVKRKGLREREQLTGISLETHRSTTSSGYNESVSWVASSTYSQVLRSFSASVTFKEHDAPISVKKINNTEHEIMVLMTVNTTTRTVSEAATAVLPPGWSDTIVNFIDAFEPENSFFAPIVDAFIEELDDVLDHYEGTTAMNDEIARVEAMKTMAEQIKVLAVETERTALATLLTSFRALVAEYHGAHADQNILTYIDDLVDAFVPSDITKKPRTKRLTGDEIARLKWGYLSCHMEFLNNPAGIRHDSALRLGPGTFLMLTTES